MPIPMPRAFRIATVAAAVIVFAAAALVVALISDWSAGAAIGLSALALAAAAASLAALTQLASSLRARSAAEDALRASQAKFSGILDIAADAIITIDEAQKIIHYNTGAELIFGWPASETIGQRLELLIPERFRRAHEGHVRAFGEGRETARRMGERREIFGLRRDGTEFPAEASISKLETGGGRLFTVVLRDITARKQIESDQRFLSRVGAVLTSSIDYESTLHAIARLPVPDLADYCVVDVRDESGRLRRVASTHTDPALDALLRRLESHPEEPDGVRTEPKLPATSEPMLVERVTREWLAQHAISGSPFELCRDLGVVSVMSVPLTARDMISGAITVMSANPARTYDAGRLAIAGELALRAEFALENARLYRLARKATRARDEVLGVVSHDLRNPISAIAMFARVLLDTPPEDPAERAKLVRAVHDSTEWMQRMIQDLLDVANIEAGRLSMETEPASIAALVERAAGMFQGRAAARSIQLAAAVEGDLPPVLVDSERILQVLSNLIGNALKFTSGGGQITVSARCEDARVIVSVSDTGPGIPLEHLQLIFQPYWHARRGADTPGSGLGLAIAKGIVEAHGGRLWVASTGEHGTTFSFMIPADVTAAAPPRRDPSSHAQRAGL